MEYPNLVFEGHSTDYQLASSLRQMVDDGIAILKVGPALTFAMREALHKMFINLNAVKIPLTLLSQFFPDQYRKIREKLLINNPDCLVKDKIQEVLNTYSCAIGANCELPYSQDPTGEKKSIRL